MIVSSPALNAVCAPALPLPPLPSVADALLSLAVAASSSSSLASASSALDLCGNDNLDDSDDDDLATHALAEELAANALAAEFDTVGADIDDFGSVGNSSSARTAIGTGIKCDSEVYLESVCFSMKEIFSVCRGILSVVDGREGQFADQDSAPWKDMKPSTKPPNEILRKEVQRRWRLFLEADGVVKPRSKSWTAMQCFTWLDANPITTPADVAYLRQLYLGRIEELATANAEAELEREMLATGGAATNKAWTGLEPYLRLIECLLANDDIRSAFLHRNSLPSNRMELENRNAPDRPPTVYELLAVCWNDPAFNPETTIVGMHEAFAKPILLSHSLVAHMIPATAEICKEKLTSMLVSMARIISKWERSGQGDGGFDPDDDDEVNEDRPEFGSFQLRSRGALDSRRSFLGGKPPYLMYLWHELEFNDLLRNSVNWLDHGIAGLDGATGVPSVLGNGSGRKKSKRGDEVFILAKSIDSLGRRNEETAKIEANMMKWHALGTTYLQLKLERTKLQLKSCEPDVLGNVAMSDMLQVQIDEMYDDMKDAKRGMKACEAFNSRKRLFPAEEEAAGE